MCLHYYACNIVWIDFVRSMRCRSKFITYLFCMWMPTFSSSICWRLFSLRNYLCIFIKISVANVYVDIFLDTLFCSTDICVSVFKLVVLLWFESDMSHERFCIEGMGTTDRVLYHIEIQLIVSLILYKSILINSPVVSYINEFIMWWNYSLVENKWSGTQLDIVSVPPDPLYLLPWYFTSKQAFSNRIKCPWNDYLKLWANINLASFTLFFLGILLQQWNTD